MAFWYPGVHHSPTALQPDVFPHQCFIQANLIWLPCLQACLACAHKHSVYGDWYFKEWNETWEYLGLFINTGLDGQQHTSNALLRSSWREMHEVKMKGCVSGLIWVLKCSMNTLHYFGVSKTSMEKTKMWKTVWKTNVKICEKYLQALQGVQVGQGNLSVPKKTHVRHWKWVEA